jgi:hypothetical protein
MNTDAKIITVMWCTVTIMVAAVAMNCRSTGTGSVVLAQRLDALSCMVDLPDSDASGFVVGTGSNYCLVMTAGHALQDDNTGLVTGDPVQIIRRIIDKGHVSQQSYPATIYKWECDDHYDIALIKTARFTSDHIAFAKITPDLGAPAYHMGSPFGQHTINTLAVGFLSQLSRKDGRMLLDQVQMPLSPGDSGGVVTGADGQCVGVILMVNVYNDSIGMMIPSREIRKWATANHVLSELDFR